MKKLSLFFATLALSVSTQAASDTVMQCAEGRVTALKGVRVNILEGREDLRGNLIFGTTVSGTMFNLREVRGNSRGFSAYHGSIRNKEKATFFLRLTGDQAENRYIRGQLAELVVIYPDLNKASGYSEYKTTDKSQFVCGKQIAPFSR